MPSAIFMSALLFYLSRTLKCCCPLFASFHARPLSSPSPHLVFLLSYLFYFHLSTIVISSIPHLRFTLERRSPLLPHPDYTLSWAWLPLHLHKPISPILLYHIFRTSHVFYAIRTKCLVGAHNTRDELLSILYLSWQVTCAKVTCALWLSPTCLRRFLGTLGGHPPRHPPFILTCVRVCVLEGGGVSCILCLSCYSISTSQYMYIFWFSYCVTVWPHLLTLYLSFTYLLSTPHIFYFTTFNVYMWYKWLQYDWDNWYFSIHFY